MQRGDPADPLLRQVLPLETELQPRPGFVIDPVGDRSASRGAGVLHKYQGRALLVTTGACGVHCRYCFRRHFPYAEQSLGRQELPATLAELAAIPGLREVILSGGDPLTLSDRRLAALVQGIEGLTEVRRLRLHTRLPVVVPSRITDDLVRRLTGTRLQTTVVLHVNHPRELAPVLAAPLARLRAGGVTLLNQAVLLRGVNDAVPVLAQLSESLFEFGVLPYYLHQLDPVAGAGHFAVPHAEAREIAAGLRARLPGYLVPRLVVEQPGAPSKLPLETVC
jgi:EF-P beta-lysylation protein EpmB